MRACILSLLTLLFLGVADDGICALYQTTDKNGTIVLTDDLQAVPADRRADVKIVSGETSTATELTATQRADAPNRGVVQTTAAPVPAPMDLRTRAVISGSVLAVGVIAFVVLGMFVSGRERAIEIARTGVVAVTALYLIYAHAGDIMGLFQKTNAKVEAVQQQSAARGKKAARSMQNMQEAMKQVEAVIGKEEDAQQKE